MSEGVERQAKPQGGGGWVQLGSSCHSVFFVYVQLSIRMLKNGGAAIFCQVTSTFSSCHLPGVSFNPRKAGKLWTQDPGVPCRQVMVLLPWPGYHCLASWAGQGASNRISGRHCWPRGHKTILSLWAIQKEVTGWNKTTGYNLLTPGTG